MFVCKYVIATVSVDSNLAALEDDVSSHGEDEIGARRASARRGMMKMGALCTYLRSDSEEVVNWSEDEESYKFRWGNDPHGYHFLLD